MYNYVHTAVARPLERRQPGAAPAITPKPRIKLLTAGEKLLYLGSLACCMGLALFVLQGRVQLIAANSEINHVEKQLAELKQQNIKLNLESKEVNSYDNIKNFIAEHKLVKINSKPLPAR